ncbi:MAG: transcriptional regulator, TetR family [Myxococcaceae bacterium]|nr:transcriptional regulator, TetR family [Myxococcaceae bacterium]
MNDVEPDKTSKRELTKLRNRAVILDAARLVFVEIGYDAATVRDIVARTKLAPGTFYNYFPDKHSVLLALVEEASAEGGKLLRAARAGSSTLEEIVRNGFRTYFEFIAGDRTLFELMRRNAATLRTLGVDETGFAAGLNDLHEDLKRAVRAGLMPPLPLKYMTRAVGALTFEIGAEMATHDPVDVEGATTFATEVCLGALERLTRSAFKRAASAPAAESSGAAPHEPQPKQPKAQRAHAATHKASAKKRSARKQRSE